MKLNALSRRQAISTSGFLLTAALAGPSTSAVADSASTTVPNSGPSSFRFCLNTATIRGQKLGIDRELKIAAEAGYDAIEPWIESIDAYKSGGGKPF